MNFFLRGRGWEPPELGFVSHRLPRGSGGFCPPGRSGPAGTTGLPAKEPHLDSCIRARSHLCSPFLGQRGQFWPRSCAEGSEAVGMSGEGGQAALFGQELLPLTVCTLSLAMRTEPSVRPFAINSAKAENWFTYVYLL